MHPAYSVIFFTTASGAGYGLLFWLGVLAAVGMLPATRGLGIAGLGVALALVTTGLLSSTFHLGRPERAWRAFSQWRTSWLSREGVAAVATYAPAALLAYGWIVQERTDGVYALAGLVMAALALATVYCTGMIYQSLPTIRAWSLPIVTRIYLVLALASGAVLLVALLALVAGSVGKPVLWIAVLGLMAAWVMKTTYWLEIDQERAGLTAGQATGLGRLGTVRQLEQPHTQANFVMREMGYRVARKHAQKLRSISVLLAFFLPSVAIVLMLASSPLVALVLACIAPLVMGAGLILERWLFFAEAVHVSMLFYGRAAV